MNEPLYIEERHRTIDPVRRAWVENVSIILRYKWVILITAAIVTGATAVYLFGFSKPYFRSAANVLPARQNAGGGLDNLAASISGTIKDLGITQIAGKGQADGFYSPLALIQSRGLQEEVAVEYLRDHADAPQSMALRP